jgi:hypothetical protein
MLFLGYSCNSDTRDEVSILSLWRWLDEYRTQSDKLKEHATKWLTEIISNSMITEHEDAKLKSIQNLFWDWSKSWQITSYDGADI